MDLLRATKRQGPLLLVLAAAALAQSQSHVWETRGFEAFRAGQFPAANLYVSRAGVLETIHRWDFNDDGYFDLIFNNTHDLAYTPPAYVYTFAGRQPERREFAGAGSVHALASDLNGDTHPELVIVRGFDNTTRALNSRIYWGSPGGPARWSERRHLELHTPYVEDACAADLNRDGRPDLVFLSASENSQVYWGQPDGYFHGNRTAFATPKAAGCLAADLDGDGATDLLASGQEARVFWSGDLKHSSPAPAGSAAALLGKRLVLSTKGGPQIFSIRNRAFHLEQEISFPGGGRTAAADLNRDGAADLVVTRAVVDRKWETASRIFWGSGAAGQERFDRSRYLDLATSGALDVAVSDLDGDGFPDIVFANSRSSLSSDVDSWVYWGGPGGYGADHRTSLATHGAQRASIAGRSVVFANSVSGRPIGDIDTYIYLGDREGSYSSERIVRLPTIGGYESCGADLNGDGASDLVLVGSHEGDMASATGSYIYWGSREGLSPLRRSEIATRGAIGCAISDVNLDGWLDLLFSNLEDHTASVWFGGAGGYDPGRELRLPVRDPRFPAIADLNRDGWPDLLAPSIGEGLVTFWGSAGGYSAGNRSLLRGTGTVSQQIADLDGDGWLDIIACNLMDVEQRRYQGVNTQIWWGGKDGYSPLRRAELPSLGAHHATVADFNRDGALDIFISNYQSEFTRELDSNIYWGNREAEYSPARRLALRNQSAAGVVSADLNGDGWVDLAVSNHVERGDHHADSLIFWNQKGTFDPRRVTALATIGPHMMTGVDPGNIHTRALEEIYISAPHDAGAALAPLKLEWEGAAPFGSRLSFALRGAASREELASAEWRTIGPPGLEPRRWWQYRITLHGGRAAWPSVRAVQVRFGGQR